ANIPNLDDNVLNHFDLKLSSRIRQSGLECGVPGDDDGLALVGDRLPQFFREEWHKRMQHSKGGFEDVEQHRLRPFRMKLDHLQVPITKLVPEKAIDRPGALG